MSTVASTCSASPTSSEVSASLPDSRRLPSGGFFLSATKLRHRGRSRYRLWLESPTCPVRAGREYVSRSDSRWGPREDSNEQSWSGCVQEVPADEQSMGLFWFKLGESRVLLCRTTKPGSTSGRYQHAARCRGNSSLVAATGIPLVKDKRLSYVADTPR